MTAEIELLRELVEIESPSDDPVAVRRVAERVAPELERLGADVRLDGDHLRADLPGEGAPLLLLGHLDTVWHHGTLAERPFRVEGGRAYGPGTFDMKGGIVILLAAIAAAGERRRPLRVFLSGDEEDGSIRARSALAEAAKDVAAAFVAEPAGTGGTVKTSRSGLARYRLVVSGHERDAADGRGNAVEELARRLVALLTLDDGDRGVLVNVGTVEGGGRANVVPAHAAASFDVRVARARDLARVERAILALRGRADGTLVDVVRLYDRPPLERSRGAARLFAKAREHAAELGLTLQETGSRGASDGNLVGALGVPVLDGLGAEGGGAHAPNEHVLVDSLPVRARLLARLLEDPGL